MEHNKGYKRIIKRYKKLGALGLLHYEEIIILVFLPVIIHIDLVLRDFSL